MQPTDDDDETLEPHACIDAHCYEKHDKHISAAPPEPEELGRKYIAEEHPNPPIPPVRAKDAVPKGKAFIGIAAVPRHEKFHRVRVANERAGEQNDLCHFV